MRNIRCVRWVVAVAVGLLSSVTLAADYSADVNTTRQFVTGGGAQANADKVRLQEYGNVDTSVATTLGGHQSTEQLKAANLARIKQCRLAAEKNFPGMTDQQKNECNAVITVAGVLYTKNPYLDSKDAKSAGLTRKEFIPSASKINAAGKSVGGQSGYTAPVTNRRTCMDAAGNVTETGREEVCSEERRNVPASCQITYNVSVADGKITTLRNDTACLPYNNASCEQSGAQCKTWQEYEVAAFEGDPNPKKESVCIEETRGYDCYDTSGPWQGTGCVVASDPTCERTGGTKVTHSFNGAAVRRDVAYFCRMAPIVTATPGSCVTQTCIGETCMDNTAAPSPDLGSMAVGMELMREAGTYAYGGGAGDPANLRIFKGASDTCKRPTGAWFGANCCNASGAQVLTNRDILPAIGWQAAGSALMSAGSYGLSQASRQMYDWMKRSGNEWMQAKGEAALQNANPPEFGFSFGAYGASVQVGVPGMGFEWSSLVPDGVKAGASEAWTSSGAAEMWSSSGGSSAFTTISETYSSATWSSGTMNIGGELVVTDATGVAATQGGLNFSVSFNPYLMAAIVALQMIQEMNACSIDEKMLSARRGLNLCQKTGEECSMRLPWPLKTCLQITETWCCWNSRLAQTVAIQGGLQLGRGNNCGGFTPDELTQLDFARIDLSSVTAELVRDIATPDQLWNASITSAVQNRTSNMPGETVKGAMLPQQGSYACNNGATSATVDIDINGTFLLKGHFTSTGTQDYQTSGYAGTGIANTWTIGNTGRYGSATLEVTATSATLNCISPDAGTDRTILPMTARDNPDNPDVGSSMQDYTADVIRRYSGAN